MLGSQNSSKSDRLLAVDLEWQAPELPLDDGQILVLDADDPIPADKWPVFRVD
jgi:hypothetical protein